MEGEEEVKAAESGALEFSRAQCETDVLRTANGAIRERSSAWTSS